MGAESIKLAAREPLNIRKDPSNIFLNIFPGEHYRLLSSIAKLSKSKNIVEIGTYTGLGSLALKYNNDVKVTTFDIVPWNKIDRQSNLTVGDFNHNLKQIIGDLSNDLFFNDNINILNQADIIFMDAPKDDKFEYSMAEKFKILDNKDFKLLIVDDIRWVNMIDFWRSIKSPKIDVTSFGHFSGTGIVDISKGLKFDLIVY